MRFLTKIGLFISSYTPLFIILALKGHEIVRLNTDLDPITANNYILIIFFLIIIVFVIDILLILYLKFDIFKRSYRELKVHTAENKTGDILSYLLPYAIAVVSFNLEFETIISLIVLLIIIFIVFVNSNLLFMNPILTTLGYKFYEVVLCNKDKIVVLSKDNIKPYIIIKPKQIDKGLYICEGKKHGSKNKK